MYQETTHGILIEVIPEYVPEQSRPEQDVFLFVYHIKMTNQGEHTVHLRRRHWIITDGRGTAKDVRGAGVIGEEPVLKPGESFNYTSFCPLSTRTGNMRGSFEFDCLSSPELGTLKVKIPLFFLRDLRHGSQVSAPLH